MTKFSYSFVALALSVAAGCTSSDATDIGDVSMNGQTLHVFREGPEPAAGVSTNIVVKPKDGPKPDLVVVWVGSREAAASTKVTCEFDSGDGDFDCELTCPNPMPGDAAIWMTVTEGDTVETLSVAIK